ncbi:amino acid ABC transporter permease [Cellulosimicrobium sp. Marseille-Q4280]|jgi:glutamate transport system permease protein|uniref:amino acid ABC transporter permease n=1 Tax=Cellulosimicrobium sp. Marseille-Q4280 TaxID=2937992 RepID=UPI00203D3765|nr:amino acid ABC transporter permease [Cellulosimicrobium sp. Marseille-Q4280]
MSSQQSILFDAPGPRARRNILIGNVVGAVVVLGLAALVLLELERKGQLSWDLWGPVFTASAWEDYFIPGLRNTLRAAAFAIAGAIVFGLVLGSGRLSHLKPVRWVSGIVVEFFRAVPVLLLMIFFWLLLGLNQVDQPSFLAVVIALVLYNGSVIAELVRSGVGNLPKGQFEAGMAIGLSRGQTLRSIQLPQALIAMLPALVSQLVVVLKDTALGQIIVYNELLRAAQIFGNGNGNNLQTLTVAAVIFIVINWLLTTAAQYLSRFLKGRTSGATTAGPGIGNPTVTAGGGAVPDGAATTAR